MMTISLVWAGAAVEVGVTTLFYLFAEGGAE